MKTVFLSLLFLSVVVCEAAKFPFHLKDEQSQDCSYCEYMHLLGDCSCQDVTWCRKVHCEVSPECDTETCDEDETPPVIEEPEIVPVTAATVGTQSKRPDCQFCVDYMLEDCYCQDVNFCREKLCSVPEKCVDHCPPE